MRTYRFDNGEANLISSALSRYAHEAAKARPQDIADGYEADPVALRALDAKIRLGGEPAAEGDAQARVLMHALNALTAFIDGNIDGLRRSPWADLDADRDEGENIPEELCSEAGYRALIEQAMRAATEAWENR